MRWLICVFIFSIALMPVSCDKAIEPVDMKKYLNFVTAIENESTFSYFTVITVKNLNTGETKEICTKGPFVLGALHTEFNENYDEKGDKSILDLAKKQKNRYFELKNKEALNNISFFDYDPTQLETIQKEYDFNRIAETIDKYKEFSTRLSDDKMKPFAHVLFNRGYLTGENNCIGGAIQYVDSTRASNR